MTNDDGYTKCLEGQGLDREATERSSRLIEAILDESTPEDLRVRMVEWFNSDMSEREKLAAMEKLMHERLKPATTKPDAFTKRKLEEIKARLNIGGTEAGKTAVRREKLHRLNPMLKVAAVLLPFFILAGGIWLYTSRNGTANDAVAEYVVTVADGIQKEVVLADNTTVWINSGSKLSAPEIFEDRREVKLEGEAFFDVAKDEGKPFIVKTPFMEVKVTGTAFNVYSFPDKATSEIVLCSGSVEVAAGGRKETLTPGQKLTLKNGTGEVEVGEAEGWDDWRTDAMYLKDKTLGELLLLIADYYDVEMVINGKFPEDEVYTFTFGKQYEIGEVLQMLSRTSGVFAFAEENGKILIEKL